MKIGEIARLTELTESQVRSAVADLRDELEGIDGVMYVARKGRDGGVALTIDQQRAEEYSRKSAATAQVQLRRVLTGTVDQMVKSAATRSQRREAKQIQVGLARLIEDLGTFTGEDVCALEGIETDSVGGAAR